MNVEDIAALTIEACEARGIAYMLTGALAYNFYGIPRSTMDVDIVVEVPDAKSIAGLIGSLSDHLVFGEQVQFDTLTWGRRHIGRPAGNSGIFVELFELFDDAFVRIQFSRRRCQYSSWLDREVWLPTAEDIVVQKLRWGRSKDLDDARDVLAVQGPETLDMAYVWKWCTGHGTGKRLKAALAELARAGLIEEGGFEPPGKD